MIRYLNFDENIPNETFYDIKNLLFFVEISLSNKIVKQKRIVYDLAMLLGEVGGLHDFLMLSLASIFGLLSNKF